MQKLGLILSAIIACACLGCGQQQKVNPQAAAFGIELLKCVDAAKTKAESQECRHAVECKYGQTDAGCP